MAWPAPVQPGDEILAAQLDSVLQAVQTWGGDVNAAGYALTNAQLTNVQLPAPTVRLVAGDYTAQGGDSCITVSTSAAVTITLPTSLRSGTILSIKNSASNANNPVVTVAASWLDGVGAFKLYRGQAFQAQLVVQGGYQGWDVVADVPSVWIPFAPNPRAAVGSVVLTNNYFTEFRCDKNQCSIRGLWQVNLTGVSRVDFDLPFVVPGMVTESAVPVTYYTSGGVASVGNLSLGSVGGSEGTLYPAGASYTDGLSTLNFRTFYRIM